FTRVQWFASGSLILTLFCLSTRPPSGEIRSCSSAAACAPPPTVPFDGLPSSFGGGAGATGGDGGAFAAAAAPPFEAPAQEQRTTRPDRTHRYQGTDEEKNHQPQRPVTEKLNEPLNQKKLPDYYLHRSNPNDAAHVEQHTYISTPTKKEAGPTNNWMEPSEAN